MEIKENALDMERWGSRATFINNSWIHAYTINCQPKVLQHNGPTSFIAPLTCIVVAHIPSGHKGFEFKLLCTERIYWLSIITLWIFRTILEHPTTVSRSLRWVSMEHQWFLVLRCWQSKRWIAIAMQSGSIGSLYRWKGKWHTCFLILDMSLNATSTIVDLASWIISRLWDSITA